MDRSGFVIDHIKTATAIGYKNIVVGNGLLSILSKPSLASVEGIEDQSFAVRGRYTCTRISVHIRIGEVSGDIDVRSCCGVGILGLVDTNPAEAFARATGSVVRDIPDDHDVINAGAPDIEGIKTIGSTTIGDVIRKDDVMNGRRTRRGR